MIVAGNPFRSTVTVCRKVVLPTIPTQKGCFICREVHDWHKVCHRNTVCLPPVHEYTYDGKECPNCRKTLLDKNSASVSRHVCTYPDCASRWWTVFYTNLRDGWEDVPDPVKTAFMVPHASGLGNLTCQCHRAYENPYGLRKHLRRVDGLNCFDVFEREFILWMNEFFGGG